MDGFDWEDAAILGGIVGFVEESLREEMAVEKENEDKWQDCTAEEDDREVPVSLKRRLQMLRASNPELADYVISSVKNFRKQGELQREVQRPQTSEPQPRRALTQMPINQGGTLLLSH